MSDGSWTPVYGGDGTSQADRPAVEVSPKALELIRAWREAYPAERDEVECWTRGAPADWNARRIAADLLRELLR